MFNNVRLAFRSIRTHPGLSVVVIVMLAFGIGATTALFSLFHQILMQPLNVPEPERLVNLSSSAPRWGSSSCGLTGGCKYAFSYRMFRDLEAQQKPFTGIAAYRDFRANVGWRDQTLSAGGAMVSGRYFPVLALQPVVGRLIDPRDEPKLGESAVVVISHDYWQTRFGSNPDVVNQTLIVNGQPLTIIGVAPAGFSGTTTGLRPQIFVPLTLAWTVRPTAARNYDDRRAYWLYLFARLNPNVSVEQASADINGLFTGFVKEFDVPLNKNMDKDVMEQFANQRLTLEPGARGQTMIPENNEQALRLLLGITALVLMIVCFNIANLLLARGASRAGEMAIRASIGGSRGQLIAQLLTESTVLAVIGGIASLPVASTMLDIISTILPVQSATQLGIELSPIAMGFAGGMSLLTVLLFGLFPAVHATRTDPALSLKEQATQSVGGRGMVRFRATLVTAQIAFSVILLVLAGLFTRSLLNVTRVNLGIEVDSLVAFSVAPRANGYSAERTVGLFQRIEEELAAQPGVTRVGSAAIPLLSGGGSGNSVNIEGREFRPDANTLARRNEVSPSFFDALSIPLVAGRNFTDADTASAPKVAIVNQSFVRQMNLGNDAVGKRFWGFPYDNVRRVDVEIIGLAADSAYSAVKGDIPAQYFQPYRQNQEPNAMTFYARTAVEPDALMRTIPSVIARIDKNLPVTGLKTMRRQVQENVYIDRLVATLSAGFAALATLLAAIGLYGVLAYNVGRRTRELGLRLALGAQPFRLRVMILRQVAIMALVGGIVGATAAVALSRTAQTLLFGLTGSDPWVLTASLAVLAAVVFAAGYVPSRRASNISPMEALRYE
jgi:putative ABC transport system permease protein